MSISGIPPHGAGLILPGGANEVRRGEVGQGRAGTTAPASQPVRSGVANGASDVLGVTRPPASLPAEAPPGTDPDLWSVLSAEERVFFAKVGAMGPLTYGRMSAELQAQPSIARGGRIDFKA